MAKRTMGDEDAAGDESAAVPEHPEGESAEQTRLRRPSGQQPTTAAGGAADLVCAHCGQPQAAHGEDGACPTGGGTWLGVPKP